VDNFLAAARGYFSRATCRFVFINPPDHLDMLSLSDIGPLSSPIQTASRGEVIPYDGTNNSLHLMSTSRTWRVRASLSRVLATWETRTGLRSPITEAAVLRTQHFLPDGDPRPVSLSWLAVEPTGGRLIAPGTVVVDTGTDPRLGEAISALGDPSIRVIRPPDRSVSLGLMRNLAVAHARGRYVCTWG